MSLLETNLRTHDLLIPLSNQQPQNDYFRLLLLSPADLNERSNLMARIERLYHQTGGQRVGIVFLIKEESSTGNGTIAFMELQTRCLRSTAFYLASALFIHF